jgi:SAM-dependent methyltransferase
MIDRLYARAIEGSPRLRRFLARRIYQFFASRYRVREWTFMNYGFLPSLPWDKPLLDADDEPDRSSIQLYNHVASAVPLAGLDVVEIGSGRGGGASFVARYLHPRSMLGIDFSANAVAFCRQVHACVGLSFACDDAERLSLADGSADVVLNVESSHCYASMRRFLSEVRRVLRRGGSFLFADFRPVDGIVELREHMRASGLAVVAETDITERVLDSLKSGQGRRLHLMREGLRGIMAKYFHELVGEPGSAVFEGFRTGALRYLSLVAQRS